MWGLRLSWLRASLLALAGALMAGGSAWAQVGGSKGKGVPSDRGTQPNFGFGLEQGYNYFGLGYGFGLGSGSGLRPPNSKYGPALPNLGSSTDSSGAYPFSYYGYNFSSGARPLDYPKSAPKAPLLTLPKDRMAHLLVIVPENAELWFEGIKTKQTGLQREFVSPELIPGKNYGYEVKARWKENDKTVEQVRTVRVQANNWQTIDFTKPESAAQAHK